MEPGDGDFELLRQYAGQNDQAAFALLVGRHVDLVFSAAMRRTRDRTLAEDVTQAVFIVLARKAARVPTADGQVSAWLLRCVRYAAANAIKMEARRQKHEQAAARKSAAMDAGACSSNPTEVLIWHEIAGQLDDAVLRLPSLDRQAVLLKYFENRSIHQIAQVLNTTEGAARQRLSRALEKLRQRLSRQGGAMMSQIDGAALAALLGSHAVRSAPAGLSAAAATAATGGATAAAGFTIAKGAMTMTAWTKTKFVAAAMTAIVIGGAGGIVAMKHATAAPRGAEAQAAAEHEDAEVSLAKAPPVVVKTVPQAGSDDVDASLKEIKVTYSKSMADGSWSWSTWGKNTFPPTAGKPHYEADHRTCVLPVKLEPGHTYAIWLNSENFGNFRDSSGMKAVPYLLVFETKK